VKLWLGCYSRVASAHPREDCRQQESGRGVCEPGAQTRGLVSDIDVENLMWMIFKPSPRLLMSAETPSKSSDQGPRGAKEG
jgi:hypothetical protein